MIGQLAALSKITVKFPNFGSGDNIFSNGFKIDNVLFTIPGTDFNIYWYGFLIAVGIIIAMVYCMRRSSFYGLNPDKVTNAVIGGLLGAVVGARTYYVVFSLDDYMVDGSLDWASILSIRDGGLAIYGGLIGGLLVAIIVAKISKCRILPLMDLASHGFLIGQCIGRWGNFFNQEAFGTNTDLPWGMYSVSTRAYLKQNYSDDSIDPTLPVHPCFLYESLWCLLGFILLHFISKKRKFDGEVFLLYIGWYGLGRFFIEGLRTDSLYLFNIRVSQLVAGTCVLVSIILIIVFRSVTKRSEAPLYKNTFESVTLLSGYTARVMTKKEKKALSKKLKAARQTGEGIGDLTKEYDEKFGTKARYNEYLDGVEKLIIENAEKEESERQAEKAEELKKDMSVILDENDESDEAEEADLEPGSYAEDDSEELTENDN